MSLVMLAAKRAGLMGQMPPAKITDAAVDAAGAEELPRPARSTLATLAHFGFGAAAGATFGLIARKLRRREPAPVQGMAFGTLVWLASYAGWVPALRIMPPPQRDREGRPSSMLVAHWVYGAVLGYLCPPRGR